MAAPLCRFFVTKVPKRVPDVALAKGTYLEHGWGVMKQILFCAVLVGATTALLVGCGGGGGGSSSTVPNGPGGPPASSTPPTATPTPAPLQPATFTIDTMLGATQGVANKFSPAFGNTSSGGQGQTVDGMPCAPVMYDNGYHVHAYLGVFVNGVQYALPWGVGMKMPSHPDSRGFVDTAKCYYYTHIHDSSGIIHVEDINEAHSPNTVSLHKLGDLLDVWGLTVNANQFGPFQGPVRVYTSGQVFRGGGGKNLTVPWTTLKLYNGDPHSVAIYSHEVIYVLVGPTFPKSLPNVNFYIEF